MHVSRPCKEGKGKNRTTKKKGNVVALSNRSPPPFSHTPFFPPGRWLSKRDRIKKEGRKENGKTLPFALYFNERHEITEKIFQWRERDPGLGLRSSSLSQIRSVKRKIPF